MMNKSILLMGTLLVSTFVELRHKRIAKIPILYLSWLMIWESVIWVAMAKEDKNAEHR